MLVFNEGVPGAGKSYDAVKEHILPALKAGRRVFARLNGLDHVAIAAYLQMPVEEIRALLVCVDDDQVTQLPKIAVNDSLIVIDEAHKYYVASREPMPRDQEDFFAEHRHDGQDIVLMSQWYRRLHSAVRARVERKAVFQKLTAVGMKNSYRVTYYQSTAPDRFEQTGAETKKYDPAMFPLYQGVRPGTTNTEVYAAGGRTVWVQIIKHAVWLLPLTLIALYMLARFFSPDSPMLKDAKARTPQHVAAGPQLAAAPAVVAAPAQQVVKQVAPGRHQVDTKGMPDEVAYVFDVSNAAKPRLAAMVKVEGGPSWGVVEWQADQGIVVERLTFAQLREMGVVVEVHEYGAKLKYRDHAMVVTAWPVPVAVDQQQRDAKRDDRQDRAQAPVVDASTSWKQSALAKDYTPPEVMRGPSRSDWRPEH